VKIQTGTCFSGLVGCDLNNVIIELNTSELPIMDGSSKYFVEALEKAGIEEQNTKRNIYVVKEIISLLMRKVGRILIMPNDTALLRW
jgi:UDP-3-O-[3-hydroxymyristoyl] N-acetylglucosamine deacetylase/3-hydroxyacyl-[acyl-carrier-protein] dehydratase